MSDSLTDSTAGSEDKAASVPPVSLSPETVGRMRSLGLPVIVPHWLPEGFSLKKATADRDPLSGAFSEIHLEAPTGAFVQICVTAEGVGDVFRGATRHSFANPFFGSAALEWYEDEEEGVDFRSPWLPVSNDAFPVLLAAGRGLSPEEAVRVVESLRSVNTRNVS